MRSILKTLLLPPASCLLLIAIGVMFDLFGCIGLVRLPDVYNRIQAGTKCVTLGVCLILLGTVVMGDTTPTRLKALLCIVFILITSPTAAKVHSVSGPMEMRVLSLPGDLPWQYPQHHEHRRDNYQQRHPGEYVDAAHGLFIDLISFSSQEAKPGDKNCDAYGALSNDDV